MSNSFKMDYKKLVSAIVFVALLVISYEAIQFKKSRSFYRIEISIDKLDDERFLISQKDVMARIRKELGFDPEVSSIEHIDFKALEEALHDDPFIMKVDVYVDANLVVHVDVLQRKPLARVKSPQIDYYIGLDGVKIPPSERSTVRVPIISGATEFLQRNSKEKVVYYDSFLDLLQKLSKDEFLEALVDQIDIKTNGEIVLIPKIGKEKIIFGQLRDKDEKLKKLSDFYKYGTEEKGWNKYAYLNLSYEGQIVGGKN